MSISTCFRPNIHQNSPEILGIKVYFGLKEQVGFRNCIFDGLGLRKFGAKIMSHRR
jgi:hypothetical protein